MYTKCLAKYVCVVVCGLPSAIWLALQRNGHPPVTAKQARHNTVCFPLHKPAPALNASNKTLLLERDTLQGMNQKKSCKGLLYVRGVHIYVAPHSEHISLACTMYRLTRPPHAWQKKPGGLKGCWTAHKQQDGSTQSILPPPTATDMALALPHQPNRACTEMNQTDAKQQHNKGFHSLDESCGSATLQGVA